MKQPRKHRYKLLAEDLSAYVEDRTNISIHPTDTGVSVRLKIQRQHKVFNRSKTVQRRGSAIQLIEYYTALRDRFKRMVNDGRIGASGRHKKIGGGALGVTGVYPNTATGYFNILVQYTTDNGTRKSTEVGTLKRTAQETAERIADILKDSVHPNHNCSRFKLVEKLRAGITEYAEEHGFSLDVVAIPRSWYAKLYKQAEAPDDMPHPDNLDTVN